jgi:hypothetical protein
MRGTIAERKTQSQTTRHLGQGFNLRGISIAQNADKSPTINVGPVLTGARFQSRKVRTNPVASFTGKPLTLPPKEIS